MNDSKARLEQIATLFDIERRWAELNRIALYHVDNEPAEQVVHSGSFASLQSIHKASEQEVLDSLSKIKKAERLAASLARTDPVLQKLHARATSSQQDPRPTIIEGEAKVIEEDTPGE